MPVILKKVESHVECVNQSASVSSGGIDSVVQQEAREISSGSFSKWLEDQTTHSSLKQYGKLSGWALVLIKKLLFHFIL
jgi:hypothetical protein